jgi:hypothetical protein
MAREDSQLTCVIDRFENGLAVLSFGKGKEIVVAKRFLPNKVKEGTVLRVELLTDEQAERRRENLARAVLKEILHNS